ncbi:MAG TPA: type ISP restriction/modification enzyme, partial [Cytophagaceae bacterium]
MPYPKDDSAFWRLVKLAERIMALHRLSGITKDMFITSFPVTGDNLVNDPGFVSGRVYINQVQYFDNVPETTWNFISGNIQPAQKWLLLRKGNSLTAVDIEHYQKMIVAITETVRLISKIHEGEFKTSF